MRKESSVSKKSERKLSNYIIDKASQLKYSSLISFLFLLGGLFHLLVFYSLSSSLVDQGLSLDSFELVFKKYFLISIGLTMFLSVFLFLIMITITHRFVGPIVPISRAIKAFFSKGEPVEIHIRNTDELKGLVYYLNDQFKNEGGQKK